MLQRRSSEHALGEYKDCVITVVSLSDGKPVCMTEVYRFSHKTYFSWQFAGAPVRGVAQEMAEGTLLILSEEPIPKPKPRYVYEQRVATRVVAGWLRRKEAYKLDVTYGAIGRGTLLYHIVLPEYCYCSEDSIKSSSAEVVNVTTRQTRQAITWSASSEGQARNLKLGLTFMGPDMEKFLKIRDSRPRVRIIPKWVKDSYPYVIEIGDLAMKAIEASQGKPA